MKKKTQIVLQFIIFLIILISATIFLGDNLTEFFSSSENVREFVNGFGFLAPLIFIFFIILQVLLFPVPGQIAGLAGGYIFGWFFGIIYSMIGLIIGSFIAFYLSRKLGRPFVEKVVSKKTLNKFDKIVSKRGVPVLFWIYLLPALPDDSICYIAGLTKIKLSILTIISAAGRFPGFLVLSIVGAGLAAQNTIFSFVLFIVMMALSIVVYLNRNTIEKKMMKFLKK